jgi:hypothetical protein
VFTKKSVNEFFVVLSSFFALGALARASAIRSECRFDAIRIAPSAHADARNEWEERALATPKNFLQ